MKHIYYPVKRNIFVVLSVKVCHVVHFRFSPAYEDDPDAWKEDYLGPRKYAAVIHFLNLLPSLPNRKLWCRSTRPKNPMFNEKREMNSVNNIESILKSQ